MTCETKTCSKCCEAKPPTDFYRGFICKKCVSKRSAEWKKANPEKARASAFRWASSEKGRKINRASAAERYKKNPYSSSKYALNPEPSKAKNRKMIDELTDCYVAHSLGFSVREAPKELIQAKREQLQISRLLRDLNKELKETK